MARKRVAAGVVSVEQPVVAPSHRPRGRRSRLVVALGTLLTLVVLVAAPAGATEPVTLLYFGADGCPYCAQMEDHLDDLEERFDGDVEVIRHELSSDPAARDRWVRELAERGHQASGVPVVILGDQVWLGFDARIGEEIDEAVVAAVEDRAATEPAGGLEPANTDTTVVVPVLGEVDAGARSALGATALIALIDGFNPCSLWVLVVLLAMVLNAGAGRGRVALVGGTFLTVTGVIYGVFIAGVFTVLGFVEHLGAIRIGVAILALFVGAVNVKDHFAYKRGLSFTIPDRFKPRIYRGGRAIRRTDRPLAAVLGTTVAMAAGISLVELPCTAGFPVIWSGIVRTQGVEGSEFAALLALYLGIYVLDELVLFTAAVATLRVGRFEERHGRLLKLVGGSVMIALGTVLLIAPRLMEDLTAAVLVILGAVAVALGFDRAHRRVSAAS